MLSIGMHCVLFLCCFGTDYIHWPKFPPRLGSNQRRIPYFQFKSIDLKLLEHGSDGKYTKMFLQ